MTTPLMLAVPSKGRLEENTTAFFKKIGLPLQRGGARGYAGTMAQIDNVEIAYLPAAEIATRLRDGKLHFGVTGEDLLRENATDLESRVELVAPLGFGRCNLVVAVPDGWVDVTTMEDLAEITGDFREQHNERLRVATKYMQLTQDFFARHGVLDYQLVAGFGAIEGAPASGAAEIIVDITSSGATLAANQLRILEDGIILQSEANLAASLAVEWHKETLEAARRILVRLEAYANANKKRIVRFMSMNNQNGQNEQGDTDNSQPDKVYQVPTDNLQAFVESMHAQGYESAIITKPDYIFAKHNEMFARFAEKMEKIKSQ